MRTRGFVLSLVFVLLCCFVGLSCTATTWQAIGPFGGDVHSLDIDPSNSQIIYAGTGNVMVGGKAFKSTGGGATWTAVNIGLTHGNYVDSLTLEPSNSQILYAGTWGGGVFKSTDSGASWAEANIGLTNSLVSSLAIDHRNSQILFAGTDGGVYKTLTIRDIGSFTILPPTPLHNQGNVVNSQSP